MMKIGDEVILVSKYSKLNGENFLDGYYIHSINEDEDTVRCQSLPSIGRNRPAITVHDYTGLGGIRIVPKNTKNKTNMLLKLPVTTYKNEEVTLNYT